MKSSARRSWKLALACAALAMQPAAALAEEIPATEPTPPAEQAPAEPAAPEADASAPAQAPEAAAPAATTVASPAETPAEASAEETPVQVALPEEEEQTAPQEPQAEASRSAVELSRIDVIGERPEQLESVPGSATVVTARDLEAMAPASVGEVLRTVPGLHVSDEDGSGLRLNVGVRGLDPVRSRSVLMLEDGVPIAMGAYGEPELYYAPPVETLSGMEVVKGSGAILFGPQTIGGVINLLTPDAPQEFTTTASVRAGTFGYYLGRFSVGNTHGNVGYILSAQHKRFEGPRALNLESTDVTARFRFQMGESSFLGLKLKVYDEFSNATYLGLTTPQFEANPQSGYATNDQLPVRRYALSATHYHAFSSRAWLQTLVYGQNVTRNWRRQDFDRKDGGRDYERIIDGEGRNILASTERPDDGSAIYFRKSTGNRNREFTTAGIEPRLTVQYDVGSVSSELISGARLFVEEVSEQRIDGSYGAATSGNIREDERRRGLALAAFAQNRFDLLERRLRITPGLRLESYWTGREILRKRVDDTNTDMNPPLDNDTHVLALIPGLGLSFQVAEGFTVFAGAHRGFAPPRSKDAITADGEDLELEAEYSVNYELGLRARAGSWFSSELTGFVLDFSNQIIPPSEAGGVVAQDAANSGASIINGGETLHMGAEAQATLDPAALAELSFRLPVSVAYTLVQAEFGDAWNTDLQGNKIPYSPTHRLAGQLRLETTQGLSAQLGISHVSAQYTDKENTAEPSADGLVGRLDAYTLVDARLGWTLESLGLTTFVAGKNLADKTYIASRLPSGIIPGMPRQFMAGVEGKF